MTYRNLTMKKLTQKHQSGEMAIQQLPMPVVGPGMVLARNHYSLISAGTEGSTVKTARKSLIGKAKERPQQVKQMKINSNNVCIWGNNLHLPLESNSFDLVISSGVIHHTPDLHKAFEECVRILKPGGRLYLRTYNIHSLYCCLYYTYGAILRLFDSTKYTRFTANLFGFKIYKLVRKLFFFIVIQ